MSFAVLKNKAGKFVTPSIESFQAATANADWQKAPGYYIVLNDQPGDQSWPITGATYILVHKQQTDAAMPVNAEISSDWC